MTRVIRGKLLESPRAMNFFVLLLAVSAKRLASTESQARASGNVPTLGFFLD